MVVRSWRGWFWPETRLHRDPASFIEGLHTSHHTSETEKKLRDDTWLCMLGGMKCIALDTGAKFKSGIIVENNKPSWNTLTI